MTRDHTTNVHELTLEQLELMAGGVSIEEFQHKVQEHLRLSERFANVQQHELRDQQHDCAKLAGVSDSTAGELELRRLQ